MAMFALTHGSSEDPETKYLVINPDKVDYKFTGKKDEHRFGVEIKENKQFHHTRTGLNTILIRHLSHSKLVLSS